MKMTALSDQNPRILLCPHSSTTAENNPGLATRRATTMKTAIEAANMITETIGEVGQEWGHVPYEDGSEFGGGRYGSVILKFYSSDFPKPTCAKADIYKFRKHLFKFKHLIGDWEPVTYKDTDGTTKKVVTFWEEKKIMIKRDHFTPNVYMQVF